MDKSKVQKQYPDFASEVESLSADNLRARIVDLQKGLQESNETEEVDEELGEARQTARNLSEPYRDVRKAVKAKTSYMLELLKDKGE